MYSFLQGFCTQLSVSLILLPGFDFVYNELILRFPGGGKSIRREKFSVSSTSILFKERRYANSFGFLYIRLQLQLTTRLQHATAGCCFIQPFAPWWVLQYSRKIQVVLPYNLFVYHTCIGLGFHFQNSLLWIFLSHWRLLHLGLLRSNVTAPT